ncbi:MAG: hypothetical protein JO199_05015 [Candidatus Eremiobacteraeota bacterium]|nr:hypothetical protein [Candidatus Eremiobacteraeota bacterium]
MISEIERRKKSPTVTLLTAIVSALAVPTSYLMQTDKPLDGVVVLRKKEHRAARIAPGVVNVVLGRPITGAPLEPSTHPPGSIERAHVVEGSVELTVGGAKVRLRTGDTCSFVILARYPDGLLVTVPGRTGGAGSRVLEHVSAVRTCFNVANPTNAERRRIRRIAISS